MVYKIKAVQRVINLEYQIIKCIKMEVADEHDNKWIHCLSYLLRVISRSSAAWIGVLYDTLSGASQAYLCEHRKFKVKFFTSCYYCKNSMSQNRLVLTDFSAWLRVIQNASLFEWPWLQPAKYVLTHFPTIAKKWSFLKGWSFYKNSIFENSEWYNIK